MQIALIYERYSQILDICKLYGVNKERKDDYGGLVGHVLHLKNDYLMVPCVGCMHMYNTLYCLHRKYGFEIFIRIGTCGVLDKKISLGSTILVEKAINRDALSEKYFSDVKPIATEYLFSYIEKHMKLPVFNTYTIDVTWETAKGSAATVDMETSALYSYANKNNLQAVSISVARDNKEGRIKNESWHILIEDNTQKVIDILEECY